MTISTYADFHRQSGASSITCRSRVEKFLGNIQANENLNAFLSVYSEEALERADLVDKKIRTDKAGKLAGLVVGIKDVIAFENHPLQAGSNILEGYHALYQSTVVKKLLEEDAIIVGRQNCDEFGMGSSNENSAFGPVRNPFDTQRVPGGSSGGSAVAVASQMCDISIGSDTGGSVRQPAAFCGTFGLKPTYSRISRHGLVAYASSFDCVGIIGQHLEDIARVLHVISGADEFDSTVSSTPVPDYVAELDQPKASYRIACPITPTNAEGLDPKIHEATFAQIESIRELGHTVEHIKFPYLEYALPAYYILATAEASSNLSRYDGVRFGQRNYDGDDITAMYKQTRSGGFGQEVKRRILLGTFVLSASYYDAYYKQAQKVRRLIRDNLKSTFQQFDLILQPTTPTTAFKLGANINDPIAMYLSDLFSVTANVAGIPAISVPSGKDENGLPIGLQFMADDFAESTLLSFSRILQQ